MNQQEQIDKNTQDIADIKGDLRTIKDNHLYHIEKDMEKQSKMIEKIDQRMWYILALLVAGVVVSFIGG